MSYTAGKDQVKLYAVIAMNVEITGNLSKEGIDIILLVVLTAALHQSSSVMNIYLPPCRYQISI